MKILVTGGAGFIGSHIVDAYLAEKHEVVVLDALLTMKPNLPPANVKLIRQDLNHFELQEFLNEQQFDVINHHAAQVNVRVSLRDPAFDATQNILATIRLLQAAVMCNKPIKKFIFSSSGGAIYGSQKTYPTPEDSPLRPESPYGLAKLSAEQYIRFFQKTYGLKAAILRYANVYGPRQDPTGEAGVISIFADLFLKEEAPTIYGDGAQTRDFVYVKDVARANVAVLNDAVDGVFNIGTGKETSVNEIADQMRLLSKSSVGPKYGSPIPGELERSSVDITRAAKHLNWRPLTNLESGLAETLQSMRSVR